VAKVLALATLVSAALILLLSLATGFNPVRALRFSMEHDREMMGTGHESLERFLELGCVNLFAFLLAVGVPLTAVFGRELLRVVREGRLLEAGDRHALAFAATLLIASFSTLFTTETERIWLFLAPSMAALAARRLLELRQRDASASAFGWTTGLLAGQIVLFEVALNTRW
jgi:hypothetical protein